MRVFIAVKLDERIKEGIGIAAKEISGRCAEGRFADPSNYHVTLEFIGETEPSRIREIESVIDSVSRMSEPFEIRIEGLGNFKKGRSGILWFGIESGRDELAEIDGRLRQGLSAAGFRNDDRAFRPHMTIGRKVVPGESLDGIAEGGWVQAVDGIVLMESARRNGKLVYTTIYESRFGK